MWATEPHGPSARVGCGEHGTGKSRLGSRKPFYVLRPAATLRLRSWLETECGIEICQGCLRTKAAKHAAYLRTRLSRGLAKSAIFQYCSCQSIGATANSNSVQRHVWSPGAVETPLPMPVLAPRVGLHCVWLPCISWENNARRHGTGPCRGGSRLCEEHQSRD